MSDLVLWGGLAGVFVVGLVVWLSVLDRRENARQRSALEAVARLRLQEPKLDLAERNVSGLLDGLALTVHYRSVRRTNGSHFPTTEVTVRTSKSPLTLKLSPQRTDAPPPDTVDVVTGDATFDRAFLIEAAPADVVRALLDADLRARLRDLPNLTLVTREPGCFVLTLAERPPEAKLLAMVDLAAQLGLRVDAAYAEADRGVRDDRGGPYRKETDASATSDLRKAREAEVANLAVVAERRRRRERRFAFALAAGLVLLVLAIALIGQATARR